MDKYTFILIILCILAGISLTIFITDLVKFCKKKKEKRVNEKVESLKKLRKIVPTLNLSLQIYKTS